MTTYDPIGQLATAQGYEPNGTNQRPHERFGYAYDAAGNVQRITNNTLVRALSVNDLNQLTTATRSGAQTVAGVTTWPASGLTVADNGNSPVAASLYADRTFARTNVTLLDGTNTFTAVATATAGWKATNVATVYLPASSSYTYDLNGNLLSDGTRYFEYDDENQLTAVTQSNSWRSVFVYDGKMRRRIRREYTWQSEIWNLQSEIRYVFDGNLSIRNN